MNWLFTARSICCTCRYNPHRTYNMERILIHASANDTVATMSILKKYYIPHCISPDIFTDGIGRTALWISIMKAWTFYDLPQCLIDHGASVNCNIKNIYGQTLLYDVIKTENVNALKFLLKNNIKIDNEIINVSNGMTPLMLACEIGNLEIAKLILPSYDTNTKSTNNTFTNERDIDGNTPLMYSSSIKITKLLLFHYSTIYNLYLTYL